MYISIDFEPGTNEGDQHAIASEVAELLKNANYDIVTDVTVVTDLDMACYFDDD